MRKMLLPILLLLLCAAMTAHAEGADHNFGFTPQKCPAYADAQRSARLPDVEAYTFLAMDEEANGCINTSSGWIEKSAVQALRINYFEPRTVVFTSTAPMYATGNTNHPIGVRIPSGTVMTVRYGMEAQQSWYIVEYDGAWGFVARNATEMMNVSAPVSGGSRILALVTNQTPVYAYPNVQSVTKKHFPKETAVVLQNRAGSFYETSLQGKTVYVNEAELTVLLTEEPGSATEGWADGTVAVWNVPDETYGKQIGTAEVSGILPVAYRMGGWCSVSFGGVEGFIRENQLSVAGGGRAGYRLIVSLSTKVLAVLNENGQAVFGTAVSYAAAPAVGEYTLEGRTDWQYVHPNYAPYVLSFSGGIALRGPLCWGRNVSTVRLDAQKTESIEEGGIVIPPTEAQWIYFHCPAGTVLSVTP